MVRAEVLPSDIWRGYMDPFSLRGHHMGERKKALMSITCLASPMPLCFIFPFFSPFLCSLSLTLIGFPSFIGDLTTYIWVAGVVIGFAFILDSSSLGFA